MQERMQQLCALAREAGQAILRLYQQPRLLQVSHKADNSPVTAADLAAHQLITLRLQQLTPDIPVLSEEDPPPWRQRQHWHSYWLIDPLDGTKEFLKHNGEFTVNIALIENGQPVLAVVYVPQTQTTYSAANGKAWKQQNDQRQRICVRSAHPPRILISRSYHDEKLHSWLAQQGEHQLYIVGSSLKFCLLAEGQAQIYPRFGSTHIWDTAAGHAIAYAAGALIEDWHGNALDYLPRESLLNPGFKVFVPDTGNQTADLVKPEKA